MDRYTDRKFSYKPQSQVLVVVAALFPAPIPKENPKIHSTGIP